MELQPEKASLRCETIGDIASCTASRIKDASSWRSLGPVSGPGVAMASFPPELEGPTFYQEWDHQVRTSEIWLFLFLVVFYGCPYDESPSIVGSVFGPLILGNSHFVAVGFCTFSFVPYGGPDPNGRLPWKIAFRVY